MQGLVSGEREVEHRLALLDLTEDHIDRVLVQEQELVGEGEDDTLCGIVDVSDIGVPGKPDPENVDIRQGLPLAQGAHSLDLPLGQGQVTIEPEIDLDEIDCDVHVL